MSNFEELFATYYKRLFMYALHILRNREDAEEAVQDAFVRAHRAMAKMTPGPCHDARLRGWLFKITLNVARNRLRKKRLAQICIDQFNDADSWHSSLEDRRSPDVLLDRRTTFQLVEGAIRALPPHLYEAARLRFIEELSHTEIAQLSAKPLGTVKSHIFRAKMLLRAQLEPSLKKSA